jgi:hypothetical protein
VVGWGMSIQLIEQSAHHIHASPEFVTELLE